MEALVWLLLLLGWHAYASTAQASQAPHVLFVSVPVYRHADPLVEIASQFAATYHVPVRFATPAWFAPLLFAGARKDILLNALEVVHLERIPRRSPRRSDESASAIPSRGTSPSCPLDQMDCSFEQTSGYASNSREELRAIFEKPMTDALLRAYGIDRGSGKGTAAASPALPALVVADRYSLAGYNFAHLCKAALVVHNPWTLLDIDDPPPFVRSPGAGLGGANLHMLSRLHNLWNRVQTRVEDAKYAQASYAEVRRDLGLDAISVPSGYCERRLVLSDSVLGYLDEPRPLPPLQQLIGAVLPPAASLTRLKRPARAGAGPGTKARAGLRPPSIVLLHGTYTQEDVAAIFSSCARRNLTLLYLGERCMNYPLLMQFCESYSSTASSEQPAVEPDAAIMFTNGDLACVHLAGVCRNVRALVLRPLLPEQREVATHVCASDIGLCTRDGPLDADDLAHTIDLAMRGSQEPNLRLFGEALRVAGGTQRASLWISRALDFDLAQFLPLDCGLAWHKFHFLDVYALYLCGLLASLVVFKVLWAALVATVEPEAAGAGTNSECGAASAIFSLEKPPPGLALSDGDQKLTREVQAVQDSQGTGHRSGGPRERAATASGIPASVHSAKAAGMPMPANGSSTSRPAGSPVGAAVSAAGLHRRRGRTSHRRAGEHADPHKYRPKQQTGAAPSGPNAEPSTSSGASHHPQSLQHQHRPHAKSASGSSAVRNEEDARTSSRGGEQSHFGSGGSGSGTGQALPAEDALGKQRGKRLFSYERVVSATPSLTSMR